jgi:hypothetical protein
MEQTTWATVVAENMKQAVLRTLECSAAALLLTVVGRRVPGAEQGRTVLDRAERPLLTGRRELPLLMAPRGMPEPRLLPAAVAVRP